MRFVQFPYLVIFEWKLVAEFSYFILTMKSMINQDYHLQLICPWRRSMKTNETSLQNGLIQNFSLPCQDFDEHLREIRIFNLQMNYSPDYMLHLQ